MDVTDLGHPRPLGTMPLAPELPNDVLDIEIAFRPHSTDLAIADGFTSVSLWSLATPTQPKRFATIPTGVPGSNDGSGPTYGMASLQTARR